MEKKYCTRCENEGILVIDGNIVDCPICHDMIEVYDEEIEQAEYIEY
jgi:hypothetical protein